MLLLGLWLRFYHFQAVCTFLPALGKTFNIKNEQRALAGVDQWIERRPENQRATGSIPSQGTCLGCGPGPQ